MGIKILTDSSADYELQEIKEKDILYVPMTINFNDGTFLDGIELSKNEFFDRLVNHGDFPSTSQPTPHAFLEIFEEAKKNNDTVIAILISSSLSGTYQGAQLAKNMAEYENIYLIDSLTATTGVKMLVDIAVNMRDSGCTAEEIVEKIEALKSKVRILAGMNTLEYLYKGGRLSKLEAGIGTLANLKPIITIEKDGKIGTCGKCIGKTKACNQIIKLINQYPIDNNYPVHLLYSYKEDAADKLKDKLEEIGITIDKSHVYGIGPTISTHIGDDAFGIVYIEA